MNVTKDGFKDRQLHMEDYLQMVSAEQKEYAGVSVYQRITENNGSKRKIFRWLSYLQGLSYSLEHSNGSE